MCKVWKIIKIIIAISAGVGLIAGIKEQLDDRQIKPEQRIHKPYGPYEKYLKRPMDAFLATGALIVLSPVLLVTAILVRTKLGSPVIFTQERPGKIDYTTGKERIFKLYKFRSMTDERDENGELMPDEIRLTEFGKKLRSTSLDELPELINIIKGDMSIVGPRPLLTEYLSYYTKEEHHRHHVLPGLTGLAQINGRNNIDSWEERFGYDLEYVKQVTFINDIKVIIATIVKVFKRSDILVGTEINAGRLDVARSGNRN